MHASYMKAQLPRAPLSAKPVGTLHGCCIVPRGLRGAVNLGLNYAERHGPLYLKFSKSGPRLTYIN